MNEEIKRLFFGVEVHAPWPAQLPHGRLLDAAHRHMTLAFLGNIPYAPLREQLAAFPPPSMLVGATGVFDGCLMLPPHRSHVVAWHGRWYEDSPPLASFQQKLTAWLLEKGYHVDQRQWLPHVTLCRQPFDPHAWEKAFVRLPFVTGAIHLYESLGQLVYHPIWSHSMRLPFEEMDHTAAIAFSIHGETLEQLYDNAFTALAFKFPPLLDYYMPHPKLKTVDDLIMTLNDSVTRADQGLGCPFKAISLHGDIVHLADATLQWEMIIDV